MIKIHTFAFLIFISFYLGLIQESESLLACGGNCPDKSCKSCICGQTQQIISLDQFCSRSKLWDVTCCKCIAARASGGNAHFMKYEPGSVELKGWYDIGVLPISNCLPDTVTEAQLCDNAINFKCAQKKYAQWGWYLWSNHASSCGCPIHPKKDIQID